MAEGTKKDTFLQRRLKERRDELGRISQDELTKLAGIRPGVVERLEQGQTERTQPGNVAALARALRWDDDWLEKLRNGEEPTERSELEDVSSLPPQLASIMAMSRELDEPTQQKALNAALRCFVAATSSE